jgi:hypothetical protein
METVSPVDARPRMGFNSVDGAKRMSDALNCKSRCVAEFFFCSAD